MIAIFGVLTAIVKKLFTNAVRREMSSMHEENQNRLREIGGRVDDMENTLARIEGRMQERWGGYRENQR